MLAICLLNDLEEQSALLRRPASRFASLVRPEAAKSTTQIDVFAVVPVGRLDAELCSAAYRRFGYGLRPSASLHLRARAAWDRLNGADTDAILPDLRKAFAAHPGAA